eukprot:549534-Amphidinium_carterae.1
MNAFIVHNSSINVEETKDKRILELSESVACFARELHLVQQGSGLTRPFQINRCSLFVPKPALPMTLVQMWKLCCSKSGVVVPLVPIKSACP